MPALGVYMAGRDLIGLQKKEVRIDYYLELTIINFAIRISSE